MKPLSPIMALFWQERRSALLGGAAMMAMTLLAGIALLGLSGWFITATALAGLTSAALAFDVFIPGASIRLLALVRTGARYSERLVTHDATLRVLAGLRERLFRGHATAEGAEALQRRPARLLFRLTSEVDALDSLYLRVLAPLAAALLVSLAVLVGLWLAAPALTWPLLVLLPLAGGLLPWWIARAALRPGRRRAAAIEALRSRAIDAAQGQVDLLMAGRAEAQSASIMAADARLASAEDTLNRLETRGAALLFLAGQAALVGTLLVTAILAEQGTVSAPIAALAVLAAMAVLEAFAPLRRGALELGRALLAARRLAPRLKEEAAPAAPLPVAPAGLALHLRDLRLRYPGARRAVLDGCSLDVGANECVALVGESGAGKSTLLSLLSGEIEAGGGHVSLAAGQPRTVWMSQRTELFQDSLRGNLLLAAPRARDAELMEALDAAGLGPVLASLPDGLDTRLGEGGFGLSSGQARRLMLARALLRPAPLWLLDEPTEGLDRETALALLDRLRPRLAGHGTLIVTHLRREAELADRLVLLRDGRVVAEARRGTPDHLALLDQLRPD
ncbi:thiol reductant ABC exporter subunit CydC [Pseudoroseomonas ludipueritiae]|uniref:Thiol reductant ABC exporter subunit CydC n=1 Tax=Pseudoroseomonas ludipueritiae TaxID=198093 RepID=A0ABR7R4I2_9PROT|nr:thiol reductant ABC exporter subunit CydC [Pseudoroseomonas ludipueritiae]MBC9176535.1 thiol reductant ABC exporter subunit CydC [Pseudoroseomonas ludipueritiae]